MSSSFKKAQKAKQRPHRERGQVKERESLGFLEKKKDYQRRARNHKQKQNHLKLLHKKALEKNPDEFYYKMINKKLKGGEHLIANAMDEPSVTAEQRKLIETQDLNYVNSRLQIENKKLAKLSATVDLSLKPKNKKVIFVDNKREEKEMKTKLKKLNQESDPIARINSYELPEDIEKYKRRRIREIKQRKNRARELRAVSEKLTLQKQLTSSEKVPKKAVKKETKNSAAIYKWPTIRNK